jgi:hypothetical protein
VALVISGCGAGAVVDPVAKAATSSTAAPGYRMTMLLQMSSPQIQTPITATGAGAVDVRDHAGLFDMQLALPNLPQVKRQLGGSTLRMREIIDGQNFYVRLPAALASRLPGRRPWFKVNLSQQAAAMGVPGLSAMPNSPFSSDPSQLMQYLRAVSGKVTKIGKATVAGYPTTEYQATIQLDREANLVPAKERAAAQASIKQLEAITHTKQLPVYVWVDNANLVRRMVVHLNIALPTGAPLEMAMQLTIPRYGRQPRPALPPAGQVTDTTALTRGSAPAA